VSLFVDISKKLGEFKLDVSFETDGAVLGLLGASGSGKSMTLKCIAGIEKPDRGRIVLDGVTLFDSERKINLPPQQRKVGYLFQNYALFPNMNVRQNILCGLHYENDTAEKERALHDIIELLQLGGFEKHKPHELSGGQQQRTALARILIGNPKLLLLDEPFSALDSHLRGQLQVQMQKLLKRFGRNALMVTHSRGEAYLLCSRIALVDNGRIIALKETKALFDDPGSRQAAQLTGCKNITKAVKTGEYEIEAPAWGVRFTTKKPVREDLSAIGIRSHCFDAEIMQNRRHVSFTGEVEEPFEYILQFRYDDQNENSPDVWWRIQKGNNDAGRPAELGVDPADVLLLYE
jgi:molybdate transport system ATP-binding protein